MRITNGEVEWVSHPKLTLRDVREDLSANECSGRGSDTAAARGYNVERLAAAIFDSDGIFDTNRNRPWFDTRERGNGPQKTRIESKSCVHRYPSGGYGEFRIWWSHHIQLVRAHKYALSERQLYFFLVYTINEHEDAVEVGKLAVDVTIIDEIITDWKWANHTTKGYTKRRDISWHLLLSQLGISVERFRADDIVVVTNTIDE
jgi:hypothetical protein